MERGLALISCTCTDQFDPTRRHSKIYCRNISSSNRNNLNRLSPSIQNQFNSLTQTTSILPHPYHPTIHTTMISRTLLRQSRASILSSSPSVASRSQSLLLRSRPTFVAATRPSTWGASARWYSSEPEVKKEDNAAATPSAEEALKVEMEKKDREIIDLKVCLSHSVLPHFFHPSCRHICVE